MLAADGTDGFPRVLTDQACLAKARPRPLGRLSCFGRFLMRCIASVKFTRSTKKMIASFTSRSSLKRLSEHLARRSGCSASG
jgi:hypothetical protein